MRGRAAIYHAAEHGMTAIVVAASARRQDSKRARAPMRACTTVGEGRTRRVRACGWIACLLPRNALLRRHMHTQMDNLAPKTAQMAFPAGKQTVTSRRAEIIPTFSHVRSRANARGHILYLALDPAAVRSPAAAGCTIQDHPYIGSRDWRLGPRQLPGLGRAGLAGRCAPRPVPRHEPVITYRRHPPLPAPPRRRP